MLYLFRHRLTPIMGGLLWLASIFVMPAIALASSITIEQQRSHFQQARDALNKDDLQAFQQHYDSLRNYPLRPYLDIWKARKYLEENNDNQVLQALNQYSDIPESIDLRIAWIKNLAQRGQWPHVAEQLQHLKHASRVLPAIALRSAWYNGDKVTSFQLLSKQWRAGHDIRIDTMPSLYAAWKQAGLPSLDDARTRIIHFAKKKQWQTVHALQHRLPQSEQALLTLWQQAQHAPADALLQMHTFTSDQPLTYPIIADTLRRLSSSDCESAWQQLKALKQALSNKDFMHLQRKIALRAAKQHNPKAANWLATLDASVQNNDSRAWHVRILLWQQNWQQSIRAIQAMPETQRLRSRWLYWHAYALQALGKHAHAKKLFAQLATGRGYYSFLSADQLGLDYHMEAKPIQTLSTNRLQQEPFIQRCHEWLQLNNRSKASREWQQGLAHATSQTWRQALQIAASWGWYDRAIQAATKAGVYDALDLRFPLAYFGDVQKNAQQTGIEDTLIWGVIRQESVFNQQAISRSGAQGLMQLMPRTARHIAKKHRLHKVQQRDLFQPSINIQLGSLYLAELLKRFDNQKELAIAAYNAGPTRVRRWQKQLPTSQPAIWIELIPFNETRRYVQQIMAFIHVYDWRLQRQKTELLARKQQTGS